MLIHVCVLVCVAPPMVVGAWSMVEALRQLFEYYYYYYSSTCTQQGNRQNFQRWFSKVLNFEWSEMKSDVFKSYLGLYS